MRWKLTANFDEPLLRYNAELPPEVIAALGVFKKFVGIMLFAMWILNESNIRAENVDRNVPNF